MGYDGWEPAALTMLVTVMSKTIIHNDTSFKLGWQRDTPDFRDMPYKSPSPHGVPLPAAVDLRPHCPPVLNQAELGSCHDANTEVLTDSGWVLFSDLSGEERLATVDPSTSELMFEKPTRLVRLPYSGDLVVGKRGYSIDFAVTPDHQMLLRKWDSATGTLSTDYTFTPASDIGWYCGLMNRVKWAGESPSPTYTIHGVHGQFIRKKYREDREIDMAVWLRFIGLYLAEGTLIKKRHSKNESKIQIATSDGRKREFTRQLFADMGVDACELDDRFTFNDPTIYEELTTMGLLGAYAPEKFVPAFVFKQSGEMIKELLVGHFIGDGCEQRGHRSHGTSSSELADDLQLLAFLSGNESHVSIRGPRTASLADGRIITGNYPEHRVSVCKVKGLSIDRNESISIETYNGEVFCAEVPTHHTLVTRRHRVILISGNCTANSIASAFRFAQIKQAQKDFAPSRLFIYYNEREMEGTVAEDSGAQIRDGFKSIAQQGVCEEAMWPYDPSQYAVKPPEACYTHALNHQALQYSRVGQTEDELKRCLADGFPISFGFTVYNTFQSQYTATTGMVTMPGWFDSRKGGHAVLLVGYIPIKGHLYWVVMNSWGEGWGDKGFFYMPEKYLLSSGLASDFWTVRMVE